MNPLWIAGILLLLLGIVFLPLLLIRLAPLNPFRYRLSDYFRVLVGVAVPWALIEMGSLFLGSSKARHPWLALPIGLISGVVFGGFYAGVLYLSRASLRRFRPKRYTFLVAWYAWLLDENENTNTQKDEASLADRLQMGRLMRRYLKQWERESQDLPPAEFIRVHDGEIRTQLPRRFR